MILMKLNLNSPIFDFMTTTANLILLNVVFIITCIPIITIGPAIAALYQVLMREARGEHGYLVRKYFQHFKEMFWQGTFTFLLFSGILFILSYAFVFWYELQTTPSTMLAVCTAAFALILISTMIYVFPLMARFQNGFLQTIKNAALLGLSKIKYTLLLLGIHAALLCLLIVVPVSRVFMLVIGCSAFVYLCSYIFTKLFQTYEQADVA